MPISNTHLRVPRGFGALLEGVTREILRDQPKDIPKYAAEYFKTLLKKREGDADPKASTHSLSDELSNEI
uniref:RIIa domain-containing protein n=1 Tax=Neogobius melanostomus TaxID=47308 RepID=A0A8C6T2H1_9GOBI